MWGRSEYTLVPLIFASARGNLEVMSENKPIDAASLRRDYALGELLESTVDPDPIVQFQRWFADAQAAKILEPNAMTLATVHPDGSPTGRVVLLKAVHD